MKRFWVEIQIGFLVIVGVALVLATGYLAYTGMNSILASVSKESKPDIKLNLIQLLATDLEKAENSVRVYAYTLKDKDLRPYYALVTSVDEQLVRLRDEGKTDKDFSKNMDTITNLVENKIRLWNQMLPLYTKQQAEKYLDTITVELEQKIENDSIWASRNIFHKIFKRKEKKELDEEKIIQNIEEVKAVDSLREERIRNKEMQYAVANSRLTQQFYDLLKRMEKDELRLRRQRALEADQMADEAYKWIGWFSLSAILSLMMVIFIITRYARKSHKYQLALVRAKNEAENLARAKEMFVANVSHELRTPMNVISGFLDQLLKKPQEDENKETLLIIKSSSDHLVRIVNDILDFSKLDSGKMVLEPQHFDSKAVFNEVSLLFQSFTIEKGIHLEVDVSRNIPDVLYGDNIRLKQILINLIGNAIKFTSQGGVDLVVYAENQVAGHLDLKISVSDTGIGIASDKLKVIFEDFTQAESGITQKFGGTGLGLSIVKKLVDLHGGAIEVMSKIDEGTTFVCRIPYKKGKREEVKEVSYKKAIIPEEVKSLKLLVVDDEVYNRKLVGAILKKWKVEYTEAENGLLALEAFDSDMFDVVLMDNRMPGMDGLEASRRIRKNIEKDDSKLAIVYFSAAAVQNDQKKVYRKAGINAYLPKPFTEEELLDLLCSIKNVEPMYEEQNLMNLPEQDNKENATIDLKQLYRVAGDDKSFVHEMLEKFIESFESGYEKMMAGINEKMYPEAGDAAHKMASPCRHIGADNLLSMLKNIEKESQNDKPDIDYETMAADALKEFQLVKKLIQEHIEELKK